MQIHHAHGYLVDNFLRDGVNARTDAYGGSVPNHARFLLEVTDAAIGVWGAGRVAVRISPLVPFNDMVDSQPESLVTYVAQELSRRTIAFLEIRHEDHALPEEQAILAIARRHFQGALMSNGSYQRESGESTVARGAADAIVYGRPYIANPDLVERFAKQAPLNAVNYDRLYGGWARRLQRLSGPGCKLIRINEPNTATIGLTFKWGKRRFSTEPGIIEPASWCTADSSTQPASCTAARSAVARRVGHW